MTTTGPVAMTTTGPVAKTSTEPVARTSTEQVAGTIKFVTRKIAEPVARTSSKSVAGASTLCTSVAKANTSVARTGTEPVAKRTIKIDPKNAIFVFPTATKETGVKVGAKPAAVVLLFSQDCATIMLELDRIKPVSMQ